MNDNYIKNVVEAALLAAGRPLQLNELAQLFDENARPEQDALRATLAALEADYGGRGIEVKETATGFRIQVRKEMANEVSRLWPERPPKYSRALLETLALIAYRQPITRAEIEAVRGVAVNPNIIKTVIERNWVRVVGTRDVPGRPELLGTTKEFLDYFGLRSLEDLPPLAELKAMGEINLQLDLAKPGEAGSSEGGSGSDGSSGSEGGSGPDGSSGSEGGSGSDEGSGSSGAGGATGSGEDGGAGGGTPNEGSVAALGVVAAVGAAAAGDAISAAVAGDAVAADASGEAEAVAAESAEGEAAAADESAEGDAVAADDSAETEVRAADSSAEVEASSDAIAAAAMAADESAARHVGEPVSIEEIELVEVVADAGEGAPAAEAATHLDVSVAAQASAADAADSAADVEYVTATDSVAAQGAASSAAAHDTYDARGAQHAESTASAAPDNLTEVTPAHAAATSDDVVAESTLASSDDAEPLVALSTEEHFVAYEHDPHAATITHVDIESDSGDVTVEVEALTFVEQQLEAEERERERAAKDASIETGEFSMSELGLATKPSAEIETEFEVGDIASAQSDDDDAADDEEELSASPQSSTHLVAAPRDRDD